MITTEEIAIRVRQMLLDHIEDLGITGTVDYDRSDYTKEDIIIVPHTIEGEGSVRTGQINVNIHVPDLPDRTAKLPVYIPYRERLLELRSKAIEILKDHYEKGSGYNWNIGLINPPMKEQNHNEHFASFALVITVRNKKTI